MVTSSNPHGLTKLDSIVQIFSVIQGPTLFLFPGYLKDVGLMLGFACSLLGGLFYLYLVRLYFWSEEELKKHYPFASSNSLYTIVEEVFKNFAKAPRLGYILSIYLRYEIIVGWLLGTSFGLLFMGQNLQIVAAYFGYNLEVRSILLYVSMPLIILIILPNLRALKHISYYACSLVILVMLEIFYIVLTSDKSTSGIKSVNLFGSGSAALTYLNVMIMTVGLTPLLFLYKQEMVREKDFSSTFGGFNIVIMFTLILDTCFAFVCVFYFGNKTHQNIIKNLPQEGFLMILVLVMATVIILSGMVVFYAIYQAFWVGGLYNEEYKDSKYLKCYELTTKLCMFAFTLICALFIPSVTILLDICGVFCSPYDIILIPTLMETVIVWQKSDKKILKWVIIFKNIIIGSVAVSFSLGSLITSVNVTLMYISSNGTLDA